MKKTKKKTDKQVLFTYLTKKNMDYLKDLSEKHNRPTTYIIELLLDAHKSGEVAKLETKIPAYVEKAKKWRSSHRYY